MKYGFQAFKTDLFGDLERDRYPSGGRFQKSGMTKLRYAHDLPFVKFINLEKNMLFKKIAMSSKSA